MVDDDVRNIFALTSVLERQRDEVVYAENGARASPCSGHADIDVVLMDVMMPEMDGYETMRAIRSCRVPRAARSRRHRQGDEGRPREVHRGRRIGLHRQTGGHGPVVVVAARMALPVRLGSALSGLSNVNGGAWRTTWRAVLLSGGARSDLLSLA